MAFTLTIPENYNYVLALPLVWVPAVAIVHWLACGNARHGSGVAYPNAYATKEQAEKSPAAFKLNCAVRAQTNFNEHAPYVALTMLAAGLQFPLTTVALSLAWGIFRLIYLFGYISGGPKGRMKGYYHVVFQLGIFLLSIWSSVNVLIL